MDVPTFFPDIFVVSIPFREFILCNSAATPTSFFNTFTDIFREVFVFQYNPDPNWSKHASSPHKNILKSTSFLIAGGCRVFHSPTPPAILDNNNTFGLKVQLIADTFYFI